MCGNMKTKKTSEDYRNLLFWGVIIGVLMSYAYYERQAKRAENVDRDSFSLLHEPSSSEGTRNTVYYIE